MWQGEFVKEYRSTDQLLDLLEHERGLAIRDREFATQVLRRTNYYRFTGYSRHYQVDPRRGDNRYHRSATFEDIYSLMLRDDELRIRLLVPLSELEQSARTRLAHLAGREFGEAAFYLDTSSHVSDGVDVTRRIARVRKDLQESQHKTIQHYRKGEDVSGVPIWVAVEALSFGKISWLLESLDSSAIRAELADFYSYPRATFPRVMQSLSALRNLCAHHGQVWNRYLTAQCPLPLNKRERPRGVNFDPQGLYPALLALSKLSKMPASRSQLAAIQRMVMAGGDYSQGVMSPEGVR